MKNILGWSVVCALLLLLSLNVVPLTEYRELIQEQSLQGAFFFITLMFLATVLAPLSALPLVPLVAPLFGPLWTALYAIVGWWLGALVAFLIARYGGKPLLTRFVSIKEIEKMESKIPEHTTFWGLVVLRMVVPVDMLSYALGLLSSVSFRVYAAATLLGIIPFALIFSYGGSALLESNYLFLGGTVILALCLFLIAWRVYKRR